jgi:hypothetical protein
LFNHFVFYCPSWKSKDKEDEIGWTDNIWKIFKVYLEGGYYLRTLGADVKVIDEYYGNRW